MPGWWLHVDKIWGSAEDAMNHCLKKENPRKTKVFGGFVVRTGFALKLLHIVYQLVVDA
jgi:hypothetical protein